MVIIVKCKVSSREERAFFIFNETFVLLLAAESCFVPRTPPVRAKLIGNKFAFHPHPRNSIHQCHHRTGRSVANNISFRRQLSPSKPRIRPAALRSQSRVTTTAVPCDQTLLRLCLAHAQVETNTADACLCKLISRPRGGGDGSGRERRSCMNNTTAPCPWISSRNWNWTVRHTATRFNDDRILLEHGYPWPQIPFIGFALTFPVLDKTHPQYWYRTVDYIWRTHTHFRYTPATEITAWSFGLCEPLSP